MKCPICEHRPRITRIKSCWQCWIGVEWWCLTTERLSPWWIVPKGDGRWVVMFWPWPWRRKTGSPYWTRAGAHEAALFQKWINQEPIRSVVIAACKEKE